jgi:2,4-dienoyl-CoA reductase-like NADH-dependent reductase (Old Yellow Enzyme family)
MSELFETTTLKNMTLPNRFVRSATCEGMANQDGSCTYGLINKMTQLARGGVGLIITGHAYVRRDGQAGIDAIELSGGTAYSASRIPVRIAKIDTEEKTEEMLRNK